MYISQISLENIRCFEDFSINLERNGKPILWTVILGDNSVGKSTLLKCIALGLCDETSAAALMKESSGEFLRNNEVEGSIKIILNEKFENKKYEIITKITKPSEENFEKIEQTTYPEEKFPWKKIFVCGYGVNRVLEGNRSFEKYTTLEAVYTLFNLHSELQNPELIFLRQPENIQEYLKEKLLKILLLDENDYSIYLTTKGMVINGPWGESPIGSLGDGYKSTTNWVVDFLGWQIFANRVKNKTKISGILLLDELENHLHPKWQRKIINKLKEQLPDVQFIVTTHSPLIASSIGEVTSKRNRDNLVYLDLSDNNFVVGHELKSLKGLDANQVLASKAFDYMIDADPEVENVLKEASVLAGKADKRTPAENKRYLAIKKALKKILQPKGPTTIEREVQAEIYEDMKKNIKELEKKVFGEEK